PATTSTIDAYPEMLCFLFFTIGDSRALYSFPTRRSSDLRPAQVSIGSALRIISCSRDASVHGRTGTRGLAFFTRLDLIEASEERSEEHTSELQSRGQLVCRLLLEKKNTTP